MTKTKDSYKDFVNEIVSKIKTAMQEKGLNWISGFDQTGSGVFPVNADSHKRYSGMNVLALFFSQLDNGYCSCEWMTYAQATKKCGKINKGEKGTRICFFTPINKEDKDTNNNIDKKKHFIIKYYYVFNKQQTNLYDDSDDSEVKYKSDFKKLLSCLTPEIIHHDNGSAYYIPSTDIIMMPTPKRFTSDTEYQITLLHELVHWTAHKSREDRFPNEVTKKSYAKEELVAEIGCTLLSKHFGINGKILNHASYLNSWMTDLKDEDFADAVKLAIKSTSWLLNQVDTSIEVIDKVAA